MTLHVQISITDENGQLTDRELAVLEALSGIKPGLVVAADGTVAPEGAAVPEKEPAGEKPAPRRRATAKKPEPTPEPEVEEIPEEASEDDLLGEDGPTVDDAVAKARDLLNAGKGAQVKAALAEVGAEKVTKLEPAQVAAFIKALG